MRILLCEDDPATVRTLERMTRPDFEGVAPVRAASVPAVAIIDIDLSHGGLDVIRELRQRAPSTASVFVRHGAALPLMIAELHQSAAGQVATLGSGDVLQAMLATGEEQALPVRASLARLTGAEPHALHRWATVVVGVIGSETDPRTFHEWGRHVGVSRGALRSWCHSARLSPRRSLLFARVLRAVVRQQAAAAPAENLLNIVDRRALLKLLAASGGTGVRLPANVSDFLDRQRLIERPQALAAVELVLAGEVVAEVDRRDAGGLRRSR